MQMRPFLVSGGNYQISGDKKNSKGYFEFGGFTMKDFFATETALHIVNLAYNIISLSGWLALNNHVAKITNIRTQPLCSCNINNKKRE